METELLTCYWDFMEAGTLRKTVGKELIFKINCFVNKISSRYKNYLSFAFKALWLYTWLLIFIMK